jgi:hypothetical protein
MTRARARWRLGRRLGCGVMLLGALRATAAAGAPPVCGRPCAGDVACVVAVARCHLDAGQPRAAIELLRPRRGANAAEGVTLLLARAYLADDNRFWALRVLHEDLALHPEHCETRAVTAWVHLQSADLERARELLEEPGCAGAPSPLRVRWQLLGGLRAQAGGDRTAALAAYGSARRAARLYAEDRVLLEELRATVDPGWETPLTVRLEAGLGWTSNGLQSSPTDPGRTGLSGRTPMAVVDLAVRLVPPVARRVRPSLEANVRGLGLLDAQARDLSYLNLLARPGVLLGGTAPRLLLAYAGQWLLLAGSDVHGGPPRWFYESHRAEAELELPRGFLLFGGAGEARFRERARSRAEADLGVGVQQSLGRVALLGALSGRVHRAEVPAYDLWGASLLAAATVPLPRGFSARGTLVLGLDAYARSRDYYGVGRDRRDLSARLGAVLFSPPWRRLALGVAYEPGVRSSTVDAYAYVDHRVLMKLRWYLEADPWAPALVTPPGHVGVWGTAQTGGLGTDRIQDLLRQEDAARRGSSCVQ